ncbi:MAG: Eco57I restriction-modification methylase domain-containing protein [Alphaproteobacteria bacterium]
MHFSKSIIKNRIAKLAPLPDAEINKAKEIFARWNKADLSSEAQNKNNFFDEFFIQILGYQGTTGASNNTIWWEKTASTGQKRVDGVLGFDVSKNDGDIRAVIEIKGDRVHLDKDKTQNRTAVEQAFDYANTSGGNCEFVIVSNFREIRIYFAGDATRHIVFYLHNLAIDESEIKTFYYLLSKDRFFINEKAKSPSHKLFIESKDSERIEKKFYKTYSDLRLAISDNLKELNKDKIYGKNFYIYKAQKLLDRIIFIRFCREKNALDRDVVKDAIDTKLILDKYGRLKILFQSMNDGNENMNIAQFNGGLFETDEELDELKISDGIIEAILILYEYDFGSDLDVNILGHILEKSITDIESLTGEYDEQKRKKDGIYYTPTYITEYMIEQTIGGWLDDKKNNIKANPDSKEWWQEYADILKSIKIVDPACGSGAFLVKAFDYLQNEWRKVHRENIELDYNYEQILINNIYGVDINVASVGITKLSLWLQTAHNKKPLTTLDDNIKIGNSLINEEYAAGYYHEYEGKFFQEKMATLFNQTEREELIKKGLQTPLEFDWQEKFSNILSNGGFDIVIGNPPYVNSKIMKKFQSTERDWLVKNYKSCKKNWDLYIPFYELALHITNPQAKICFITPNKWLSAPYGKSLRDLCFNQIKKIIDVSMIEVFDGIGIYPVIILLDKIISNQIIVEHFKNNKFELLNNVDKKNITILGSILDKNYTIIKKIDSISTKLKNFCNVEDPCIVDEAYKKIKKQLFDNKSPIFDNKKYFKFVNTGTIDPYIFLWGSIDTNYLNKKYKYPLIEKEWLRINLKRRHEQATADKIIFSGLGKKLESMVGNDILAGLSTIIARNFVINKLYLLSILNSRVINFFIRGMYKTQGMAGGDVNLTPHIISSIPIKKISEIEQKPFIQRATAIIEKKSKLYNLTNNLLELMAVDLNIKKPSKKLEKWYQLSKDEFFLEIEKKNKKISLPTKNKWIKEFNQKKSTAFSLYEDINKLENDIDTMTYQLYHLTTEEIKIIEESIK